MISGNDIYHVISSIIPLYVAMILAYVSVKWLKLFTPDQVSGINKFVAKFSIPLLSFQVISGTNPYKMNHKLIIADTLQKIFAFLVLIVFAKITGKGGLKGVITGFSLTTMPNTLIVGIPLLGAMYGKVADGLLAQIIVLQIVIWFIVLLFLFEWSDLKTCPRNSSRVATEELDASQDSEGSSISRHARTKTRVILLRVGRELITNPNTHATILGLIWALIHFGWHVNFPEVVDKSISIMSAGGLGMAMFSLGLFMALRPNIIACGTKMTLVSLALRFLLGPALMAISSVAIGLRGVLLKVAVIQAALPQGIVPFVFAEQYDIHPDILSAGITLSMIVCTPVALGYYILFEL